MHDITSTESWGKLEKLHAEKSRTTLRDLFRADAQRAQRYTFDAAGLRVDLSKNLVDGDVAKQLLALADEAGLKDRIEAMFTGEHINTTEDRAVLHTALRAPEDTGLEVDGQNVTADVHAVLKQMREFASKLRSGEGGPHRQDDFQGGQHRHRRLGSGPCHGREGAAYLRYCWHHRRVRLQRGPGGYDACAR